jgi:hypothetical protein
MAKYNMRFRRSIGGKFFRVNFTKTGVGYSYGIPGFRRSYHSSGRRTTTFGLPGTGIYWRKDERVPPRLRGTPRKTARKPLTAAMARAGWYFDPYGAFEYRWWDGGKWTGRVARDGAVTTDYLN